MTVFTGAVQSLLTGLTATSTQLGYLVDAVKAVTEAPTSWTPVWTGDTTNPVINNGTLSGQYLQSGKLVIASFKIVSGSTTTYGSGAGYLLSLPVTASVATLEHIGGAIYLNDTSAGTTKIGIGISSTTTTVRIRYNDGTANWGPTSPWTMANGDSVRGTMTYWAA